MLTMSCRVENRRSRFTARLCLVALFFVLYATSCAENRKLSTDNPPSSAASLRNFGTGDSGPVVPRTTVAPAGPGDRESSIQNAPDDKDIENMIRAEYRRWQGTQHRLGGNDRSGIDCSGFVKAVYRGLFKIDLPRTTREQVRQGIAVKYEDMRAGDLVFFRPPDYPRHVGIYLSDSQFVHASKSQGVVISKLDRHYWRPHFWTARRILTDRNRNR
jgi:cell wall-associated NlpC family hydrolase